MEKIFIGSDHGGFELKEKIKMYLMAQNYIVIDKGNSTLDVGDDYPDFAEKVTEGVLSENAYGILICSTGVGMCMASNKRKGIRAVNAFNVDVAEASRQDENTNVLCLGQRFIDEELALKIVDHWMAAKFSGAQRHLRRLGKIRKFEEA